MRRKLGLGSGLLAASLLIAAPVQAQEADSGLTISGGATLVSDYRFRGISQTDRKAAVQGSLTIAHPSGPYASVWGSSIDDYVAGGADQEIDLIAGYRNIFGGTTLDTGVVYYHYPGSANGDTDFFEPFVSLAQALGPVTAKALVSYAPRQKALTVGAGREDNLYLAGDLSAALPGVPLTLSAHLGHSFGPSYLTIGKEYTDWSPGASYTAKSLSLGLSYVDTDAAFISPSGRNASKAGLVASLGVAF